MVCCRFLERLQLAIKIRIKEPSLKKIAENNAAKIEYAWTKPSTAIPIMTNS